MGQDFGEDASGYGFPSFAKVVNQTAMYQREPPILDVRKHLNSSYVADGQVGGHLPVVRFSFPVSSTSPYLPKTEKGNRHWSMIVMGVPDMKGSCEQSVWFRFQQISCSHGNKACSLIGAPQFYDTYWWSNSPGEWSLLNAIKLSLI